MAPFGLTRRCLFAAAMALTLPLALVGPVHAKTSQSQWVTVWSTAQMTPGADSALSPADATDATLRQTIRVAKGGDMIRLRLSNATGTEPLSLRNVHIARATITGGSAIDPASDRPVTFGGLNDIVIPAGADYISDPISITVADQSVLAISFHMPTGLPQPQTGHPGSRTTSWLVPGDHVSDADLPEAKKFDHWFTIAGLDIESGSAKAAVVAFGDSITDGYGIKPNSDTRWPDFLGRRLKDRPVSVLNAGIGGNRLLLDGLGPNAQARFDRDVLSQSGVKYVIVLESVNDLGVLTRDAPVTQAAHDDLVARLKVAYLQMVTKAHSHGLKIYGGTITPFIGMDYYHPDALNEADRQAINSWIRTSGAFDAVIDFDAALRDPVQPDRLSSAYDSGDHLHPSSAGYQAMAEAVDLKLFEN
ncbi:SGNH/GDSL hydrolase family protein [Asticcacaulis taihuensis]|uniref:Lysophospholipase L1 n=1 Tax=Asticcacaulis taihuensis TaxID=260084 RepID=A0A1G4Q2F0_9CAUL|nr:SGNH/GDSL hydrolase family protein [Asticcacaulis taihuensis]SCW38627.1 Lysophospholipase L1 [Asticcacaulis taihuensis]